MVKLNFDKLKSQVKNSFNEELWNGHNIFAITTPLVILFCATLLWMTKQSWIFWGLVLILVLWFRILKNRTNCRNNTQEPPVLVVERTKGRDYELFLKKASRRRTETDKLSFTFGDLVRSRDPQWLNHAISTVWRHLRRPSEDFVLGQLWPTVQKVLKNSTSFVKMELFRFELGSIPPRVEKIEVHELEADKDKMVQ